MSAKKFPHYFFFRDILLEKKQSLISIDPKYSYNKNNWDDSYDRSQFASLPITFGYGLSNMINLKLNLRFKIDEDSDDYSIFSDEASGKEKIGTGRFRRKVEYSRSDIGLYLIPSSSFLLAGTANLDHQVETFSGSDLYFNGFNEFYKSVYKRDAYAIHLRANYLSIHRALSTVDFRRSFYNGTYLKKAELKNQIQLNFYSEKYDEDRKWVLNDKIDFELTNNINLFLNTEYARMKHNYRRQNGANSWRYSPGIVFYNLSFEGDELNDFDYFYGRIIQPKDYIATLQWQHNHEILIDYDLKSIRLDLQTGLIRTMDVQLNYSLTRDSYKFDNESIPAARWRMQAIYSGEASATPALSVAI